MSLKGKKFDEGKPPLNLIPGKPMLEIAKVLAFGKGKYGAWNWTGGMEWGRLVGSIHRHLLAWQEGEDEDPESGFNHLAHAGCGLIFLLAYQLYGMGEDDRWKPSRPSSQP